MSKSVRKTVLVIFYKINKNSKEDSLTFQISLPYRFFNQVVFLSFLKYYVYG